MKMVITRFASRDIERITDYFAKDSPSNAAAMLDQIRAEFARIAAKPSHYRDRIDIRIDLRLAPVGSYIIVFRKRWKAVRIERVLHGMRNLPTQLG